MQFSVRKPLYVLRKIGFSAPQYDALISKGNLRYVIEYEGDYGDDIYMDCEDRMAEIISGGDLLKTTSHERSCEHIVGLEYSFMANKIFGQDIKKFKTRERNPFQPRYF